MVEESQHARALEKRYRFSLLIGDGIVMSLAFWVLISLALKTPSGLISKPRKRGFGGPLTWPARWLHLRSLSPTGRSLTFIALMVVLTLGYLAAIYLVRRDNRRKVTYALVGFFAVFALLFLFMPPFMSRDLYSYVFYGRVMSVYHRNPYILIPVMRRHDLFYPLLGWRYNASVYGPVFNWLSYLITRIAGNHVASNVLGFKVLASASYAACLPIIYSLTRRVSPGRENLALAVSAWCPILVMHTLGGGHNDIMMAFFVLTGFLLYRKDHQLWGIVVVTLAVMVKLTAALALLPLLVLYLRDKRGKPVPRAAAAAGTIIAITAISYLPFWKGIRIFNSTRHMSTLYSFSSVPRLVSIEVQRVLIRSGMLWVRAETLANQMVQLVFLAVFAVVTIYLLTRVKDYRSMIISVAAINLVWFLTSIYILPWYLAVGLMVACVAGWNMTTAAYVTVASFFTFYHIPATNIPTLAWSGRLGTDLYLSLPFFLILTAWLGVGLYYLRKRRNAGSALGPGSGEFDET